VIVLLDSDILIEASKGRNEGVISALRALAAPGSTMLYSPVSAAEIWAEARPHEFEATTKLFLKLSCVQMDYAIGELAGEFLRRYAKSHSLEVPDALIAASAVKSRALLWTQNRKHYPMPELTFYSSK
jgi:predicted nucleic acid-binding protein